MAKGKRSLMAEDNRSLIDLPRVNLEGVLINLPLPSLLVCCCVSKSLLSLITNNSDFVQMHLAKSEPQLMIQFHSYSTIHLIDLDTDTTSRVEVKPSFNIPLDDFQITDSSNGLLLLESRGTSKGFHRYILCNPVTGEYTMLPESATPKRVFMSAVFYCPKTNHFEVLCTFDRLPPHTIVSSDSFMELDPSSVPVPAPELFVLSDSDSDSGLEHNSDTDSDSGSLHSGSDSMVQLYVGGSGWVSLGLLPFSPHAIYNSCHLDKTVYWLCKDDIFPSVIIFFNFERYEFGEIPGPGYTRVAECDNIALVARGNYLSIFYNNHTSRREITVWVMKERNVEHPWSIEFVIDTSLWDEFGIHCCITPVMCRNNGEVVMVSVHGFIIYYDLLEKRGRIVKHPPLGLQLSKVVHTPSLISLRDIVRGSNLEVINVAPRFTEPGLIPDNYLQLSTTFTA